MSVHLTTFASPEMSRSAELCYLSARRNGVDIAHMFSPDSLKRLPCYERNRSLFDAPRGRGYWAWKAALLNQIMGEDAFVRNVREGEIVVYSDAGVEFINSVNYIIDRMDQDIFLFGNQYEHAHWCKRDIVEAIWPLSIDRQSFVDAGTQMSTPSNLVAFDIDGMENLYSWARFGKQVQASVIFFRVNDKTRAFVKEWLDWCVFEGGRLIDDSPSRMPNHPEFQENRHDQAILTTMAYRDGIKLHWWPAQYNDGAFEYPRGDYPDEGYPSLFHHHRGVKTGERAA